MQQACTQSLTSQLEKARTPKEPLGIRVYACASSMANPTLLPADLWLRLLDEVPLASLPRCLASLRLVGRAWDAAVCPLLETLVGTRLNPSVRQLADSRRSLRNSFRPPELFAQAVRALVVRSESLSHGLACLGQDDKNLSSARVRKIHARWQPVLLDHPSAAYDATPLMEVCRARGVYESAIVAAATELLQLGASARATNADGCSPLIIAAARGLPKVVSLLLAHGADPTRRGRGRFRLGDTRRSLRGERTALEWVDALIEAEASIGVDGQQQRSLKACRTLLARLAANSASGHASSTLPEPHSSSEPLA